MPVSIFKGHGALRWQYVMAGMQWCRGLQNTFSLHVTALIIQ